MHILELKSAYLKYNASYKNAENADYLHSNKFWFFI